MKTILVIMPIAALFACNNQSDSDTTKGNTDTTDSVTIKQDNTINRDTAMRMDTGRIDTSNRRDSIRK